jgi:hypothetical protein
MRQYAIATLIVAVFTLLASTTSWFKPTIPIQFGFLVDGEINKQIDLSTGDKAKAIFLRFLNSEKATLTGVVLSIRFYRPLALSGTKHAIEFIPGETFYYGGPSSWKGWAILDGNTVTKETTGYGKSSFRGPALDNRFYKIQPPELVMGGDEYVDVKVELNTQNMIAGKTYWVDVTINPRQPDYKQKQALLSISMK